MIACISYFFVSWSAPGVWRDEAISTLGLKLGVPGSIPSSSKIFVFCNTVVSFGSQCKVGLKEFHPFSMGYMAAESFLMTHPEKDWVKDPVGQFLRFPDINHAGYERRCVEPGVPTTVEGLTTVKYGVLEGINTLSLNLSREWCPKVMGLESNGKWNHLDLSSTLSTTPGNW